MAATTHSTTGIPYAIIYSRADRDYAITVDGQYIGSAATYHDAEERVREYFYDLISSGALYTATELDGGSSVEEIVADAPLPTVTVTPWQGEAGAAYTDFTVGNGLTKVLLGTHSSDKSGVELVVGGACINERSDEVLTLDDVRQLRDNLTALLHDTRVLAAVESAPQAPQPPTPAAPAFPIPTAPTHHTQASWQAQIGALEGMPVTGCYAGRELMSATVVYQGVPVSIYAADRGAYLNVGVGDGLSFPGDMYLAEWRILQALSRTALVDRLLAVFQRYGVAGAACTGAKAA